MIDYQLMRQTTVLCLISVTFIYTILTINLLKLAIYLYELPCHVNIQILRSDLNFVFTIFLSQFLFYPTAA